MKTDPYHDSKIYHKLGLVDQRGKASALCYAQPRAISRHDTWTTDDQAVTCKNCIRALKAQPVSAEGAVLRLLEQELADTVEEKRLLELKREVVTDVIESIRKLALIDGQR
jgi:hypothetical protein